ncbi:hypothetical protein BCT86_00195 [Vibrio breoganii]|uniref:glycosyltransferase family 2 protein n=1 Tax=Vibrio breoganii TaxID=553239 RepID=UPI000C8569EA|nr:glycosyltransferase family 2 protein [Vibrio breoganii]PML10633.1 hypothetical protein BCT86_00195 [Vibrio breoganii]
MLTSKDITAIFTTYEPSKRLLNNIELMINQVDSIIVVDDGSQSDVSLSILKICSNYDKLTLHRNIDNLGIAHSLNIGLRMAEKNGYKWALTMDQDSRPSSDMVYQLCNSYNKNERREQISLVTPNIIDEENPDKLGSLLINSRNLFYKTVAMPNHDRDDLLITITSGSLTNISKFKKAGPFPTEFFIDYVDTYLSLKLVDLGYIILYSCSAKLYHNLGEPRVMKVANRHVRALNHKPYRRYYMARNSLYMYHEFALKQPSWALYDLYIGIYSTIAILLFEDKKVTKLSLSLKGFYHAILGKKGKYN